MKPFNENARCEKCGYDAIKSKHDDGLFTVSIYASTSWCKMIKKWNETAQDHIKRTCSRCEYSWNESVVDNET